MTRILIITALLLASPAHAKDNNPFSGARSITVKMHKDKPWPRSQCTNGWVDRMTGKCPYRAPKKRFKNLPPKQLSVA